MSFFRNNSETYFYVNLNVLNLKITYDAINEGVVSCQIHSSEIFLLAYILIMYFVIYKHTYVMCRIYYINMVHLLQKCHKSKIYIFSSHIYTFLNNNYKIKFINIFNFLLKKHNFKKSQ